VGLSPLPEPAPSSVGMPMSAVPPTGPFAVSTVVVDATAVLSLTGRVDLAALPTCRRTVDDLLREGVGLITLDLQVAHFDDESIALIALMRRYALRHGARLVLVDIPPHVARVLDRTGVGWLYRSEDNARDAEKDAGEAVLRPARSRRR
jgi:anti-anti-sigma factor